MEARNWAGLVEAAMEVGRKRHDILWRMRAAFKRNDEGEALRLGRELCGLENEEASAGADSGIN